MIVGGIGTTPFTFGASIRLTAAGTVVTNYNHSSKGR